MQWIDSLNRDLNTLTKSERIKAIKDDVQYFPSNEKGLLKIRQWIDLEFNLTLKNEPDSDYLKALIRYRDDLHTMCEAKYRSAKLWRKAVYEAKERFLYALSFAQIES